MLKYLFTAVVVLSTTALSLAMPNEKVSDANIGGHVIDKETGDHIPGCLVTILNSDYAAMTDASGHYMFRDLIPGEYEVQVSFMGYSCCVSSKGLMPTATPFLNVTMAQAHV